MSQLNYKLAAVLFSLFTCADLATATPISYSGTFASPEDVFSQVIKVPVASTITLQTFGFGGGINANGTNVSAGGFDPLVGLFSGTGNVAQIIDATSDDLSNYSSYIGCPPAGTVTIGSVPGNCGDIRMALNVAAGTYTAILTDAAYIPNAVYDNGTLGEGFLDLTPQTLPFQTCADLTDCNIDTANWALDVTISSLAVSTPEPDGAGLLGLVLVGAELCRRYRRQ